jgi:hypothetical protein
MVFPDVGKSGDNIQKLVLEQMDWAIIGGLDNVYKYNPNTLNTLEIHRKLMGIEQSK